MQGCRNPGGDIFYINIYQTIGGDIYIKDSKNWYSQPGVPKPGGIYLTNNLTVSPSIV